MISVDRILVFIVLIKFFLDVFSPFREFNFVLGAGLCVFFLIARMKVFLRCVTKAEIIFVLIYWGMCTVWFLLNDGGAYYAKYASLVFWYFLIKVGFSSFNLKEVKFFTRYVFIGFSLILLLSLLVSFLVKDPLSRVFYNFEHANLFGSYILVAVSFLYVQALSGNRSIFPRVFVVLMALISTSTGAFLSSLMVFVNFRKISVYSVLVGFCVLFSIVTAGYFITGAYFHNLFLKLYGPISLVVAGDFSELAYFALNKLPIQGLGDQFQSSFLWRMYAYIVYFDFIVNQDLFNLVFGNGFSGFEKVWEGFAPHNDFILVLVDFGLIGLLPVLYFLWRTFNWCLKRELSFLPLFFILIARLLFENNINSYYLISSVVMAFSFLYFAHNKVKGEL